MINMKRILFVHLVIALLSGCSNVNHDHTLSFIPGTYVRSGSTEFGRIEDTIEIKIQNKQVYSFLIEQRWRYDRVLDGVALEPEYKVIEHLGIYNPETKLLQNQRNLLFYSFDIEKQVLYFGTLDFQKIK
jgi:hypothetical protein